MSEHTHLSQCLSVCWLTVFIFMCQVRDSLNGMSPDDVPIPYDEVKNPCRTGLGYQPVAAANSLRLSALALLLTLALQALITLKAL